MYLCGIQFHNGDNCFNFRTIFCHRIPDLSPRLHAKESVNLPEFGIVCSVGDVVDNVSFNCTSANSVVSRLFVRYIVRVGLHIGGLR